MGNSEFLKGCAIEIKTIEWHLIKALRKWCHYWSRIKQTTNNAIIGVIWATLIWSINVNLTLRAVNLKRQSCQKRGYWKIMRIYLRQSGFLAVHFRPTSTHNDNSPINKFTHKLICTILCVMWHVWLHSTIQPFLSKSMSRWMFIKKTNRTFRNYIYIASRSILVRELAIESFDSLIMTRESVILLSLIYSYFSMERKLININFHYTSIIFYFSNKQQLFMEK